MERLTVNRIPGFQDVSGKNQDTKAAVEAALFNYIGVSGYETIETPIVEDVDLFLRMSGGELASQMYSFTAPGGHRVALRPEFTASIVIFVFETKNIGAAIIGYFIPKSSFSLPVIFLFIESLTFATRSI